MGIAGRKRGRTLCCCKCNCQTGHVMMMPPRRQLARSRSPAHLFGPGLPSLSPSPRFRLASIITHPLSVLTNLTHRVSWFDDCHRTSRHELFHRSRGWTIHHPGSACWCVFLTFSSLSSRLEVLMDHGEDARGRDPALPTCEAQPVVSRVETLDDTTSSSACCCIPGGVFRPFTSTRGGSNIDHSQRNVSEQSAQQARQDSSKAECAYFLTITETSLA